MSIKFKVLRLSKNLNPSCKLKNITHLISKQYIRFWLCSVEQIEVVTQLFKMQFFGIFSLSYGKINNIFGILRQNWTR